MERGNSKHGPRLDNQMSREANEMVQGTAGSRVEEFRQPEPAGEDQPEATAAPAGELRTGAPPGMSSVDVEQRSRLGRFIHLSALPADRDGLLRNARDNQAPADIIAELDRLPPGTQYQTVSEVWAALGHRNETRRW
jgi:hypothetical protein